VTDVNVVLITSDNERDGDWGADGEINNSTGSVSSVCGGASPDDGEDFIVSGIGRVPAVGVDEKVRELWRR
jgi:hypothetical protein